MKIDCIHMTSQHSFKFEGCRVFYDGSYGNGKNANISKFGGLFHIKKTLLKVLLSSLQTHMSHGHIILSLLCLKLEINVQYCAMLASRRDFQANTNMVHLEIH